MYTTPRSRARVTSLVLKTVALVLVLISLTAYSFSQTARTYNITDLGTLGGARSVGTAINASGQVTGWSDTDSTLDHPHAFVYTPGTTPPLVDIGDLGGDFSAGSAINRPGQVTGWSMNSSGAYHVFLYTPGTNSPMIDLRPTGFGSSYGLGLNDSGFVTGSIDINNGGYHAFLYKPGIGITDLTPSAINAQGRGMNNRGWITGFVGPTQTVHAFLYTNSVSDLGVLSNGSYSEGNALNDAGEITGTADSNGLQHAFISRGGQLMDLDPTGPFREGIGINSCGEVVGDFQSSAGMAAFLYDSQHGIVDLNSLIPEGTGWVLSAATAINDKGQITGFGYHDGAEHAFLLNPNSGSFECAASMHLPRTHHAAALLSGGDKVLISGGSDGHTGSLDSAEVFDVSTRNFRNTGRMLHPRYSHTSTLLDNGQVLIAGGYDSHSGTYIASSEYYNPTTDGFEATASSMSIGRQNHTATVLGSGKVLIAGGLNASSALSSAELYDPTQRSFSPAAGSMSFSRYGHSAVRLQDGRVLITGGCGSGMPDCTNTAELYDPTTNTFRMTASPMLQARAWHSATLLTNGTVLIVGGVQGNLEQGAELYDPFAEKFSAISSPLIGMNSYYHTSTSLLDGSVLIAGGDWINPAGTTSLAQLYGGETPGFDPASGTMSSTRSHHTATRMGNGKVLLAGGEDADGKVSASADLYDGPDSITQKLSSTGASMIFPVDNGIPIQLTITRSRQTSPSEFGSVVTAGLREVDGNLAAGLLANPFIPGGAVITAAISTVSGLGGDGVVLHIDTVDASDSASSGSALSALTTGLDDVDSYAITLSWNGPAGSNPGLLKQTNTSTPWENVLLSYSATTDAGGANHLILGRTKLLSGDYMIVYNVDPASSASITLLSPTDRAIYYLNQDVHASYTCTNSIECIGDVESGTAIDTKELGTKTFTILATVDGAHTPTVKTVTYEVVAPSLAITVNASKILNALNPSLSPPPLSSITYTGFMPGDDASSLTGTLSCTTTALQKSPVGKYPITCSGLSSSKYTITYVPGTLTVVYAAGGSCLGDLGHAILQPINVDGSSVWKQGRTIPAKFRVCDANGVSIGTSGLVSSVRLAKIVSGTAGNVDENDFFAIADSTFRWDQNEQLWIYNMRTTSQSAGYTYMYIITLNDNSEINFQYGLR